MADPQLPLSPEDRAITRMIVDRVRRRGNSLAEIARTSGIELNRLVRLARLANVHYRNRRASPERIRLAIKAVIDEGLPFRAAARRYGMSKTAVHRFVQKQRNKIVDSAGDLKVERRQWRCEVHGPITVFPCVACAAQSARDL
jgi:DNA invertase Pin-like site-specific DNA recombinase